MTDYASLQSILRSSTKFDPVTRSTTGCAIPSHMPNYRRANASGGCFFFTVNLLERRQTPPCRPDRFVARGGRCDAADHPFAIDAFVVLPDHLHAIWTLPPDDRDFSTRWRLIKSRFAKALPKRERLSNVRIGRGERGIWQRRFWEHLIRNESDYARHVDYCYINPVKHGLVKQRWRDGGLRFAPIRPTKFHPVTRTAQG